MSSVMERPMGPTEAELFAESLTVNAEKVKIYIGAKTPDSNPLEIPKALLIKHQYFRMALSSRWREGQDNILHFPEDSKEAWAILLAYLYGREIEWAGYGEVDPYMNTHSDEYRGEKNLLTMAYAYALAEKYLLPATLKNQIIRASMEGCRQEQIFYEETYTEFFAVVERDWALRRIVLENLICRVKDRDRGRTLTAQGFGWRNFQTFGRI